MLHVDILQSSVCGGELVIEKSQSLYLFPGRRTEGAICGCIGDHKGVIVSNHVVNECSLHGISMSSRQHPSGVRRSSLLFGNH